MKLAYIGIVIAALVLGWIMDTIHNNSKEGLAGSDSMLFTFAIPGATIILLLIKGC